MSHRAGALGMDRPLPAVAKYALQYLFVQAEFGLMCPISVTDTSIHLIRKFAEPGAAGLSAAENAVGRPRHDVEGHAVHDRTRRRLRRRHASRPSARHEDGELAALRRQVVLLARRRRRGAAAGAARRRARRHQGARAVRAAAAAQGRQPQRLPHRAPQGQARHPLDGVSGEILLEGARRLSGRRGRPGPQADDGAGQPVAAVAWRARRRDDAPLRQRGDGRARARATRSATPSSIIRCCAAS